MLAVDFVGLKDFLALVDVLILIYPSKEPTQSFGLQTCVDGNPTEINF